MSAKNNFFSLPTELYLEIMTKLNSNNHMISLRCTCKYMKQLTDSFGYIKHIQFSLDSDYMNFIHLFSKRNIFLEKLTIHDMQDPFSLIPPQWPKEVIINSCYLPHKIDPIKIQKKTEVMIIRDFIPKNLLKINWEKFPSLRILDIKAYDVDIQNLHMCKKLEVIKIDTDNINNDKRYDDELVYLSTLPNLKKIGMSFVSNNMIHYVSKDLECCYIPKRKTHTSPSTKIPSFQLESSGNISRYMVRSLEV